MAEIPIYGPVACSNNVYEFIPRNEMIPVAVPVGMNPNDIGAAICSGPSLENIGVYDGDIILFTRRFTERDTLFRICIIFITATGETVAKKLHPMGNNQMEFVSSGGDLPSRVYSNDEFEIKGVMIGYQHMLR